MKLRTGVVAFLAASVWCKVYAAELPAPSQISTPAVLYSWTGCYFGVAGGGSAGQSQSTAASSPNAGRPITNKFDVSGALVGGTAGCDYQLSAVVFGIENDFSWTGIKGSASDIPPFNTAARNTTNERWLDTARGRIGFVWDRLLIYGTGGAAFANTSVQVCGPAQCVSDSQIRIGWLAGAGVEWAVWTGPAGIWTVKLEFLHADFGSRPYINPPVVGPGGRFATRDVTLTNDIVRGGVNWKLNWP